MSNTEFRFRCPQCQEWLRCESAQVGRQVQCPSCNFLIRIPNPPPDTGFSAAPAESGHTWDTFVPKGEKAE